MKSQSVTSSTLGKLKVQSELSKMFLVICRCNGYVKVSRDLNFMSLTIRKHRLEGITIARKSSDPSVTESIVT
jgi:hypothetical protein